MYISELSDMIPADLPIHQCAQLMDESLRNVSTELLYVNDETSLLKRANLKARLMISYARYANDIRRCNHLEEATETAFFDDKDLEDY
jgi:hypothetical protein